MTSQLRLLAAPGYVLLIGLVFSAAVALQLADVATQKDEERFQNAVIQTHDTIERRIDTYVAMLESAAAMLAAVDLDLSQAEFRAFAERLNMSERYPGAQGVGYTVRVRQGAGPMVARTMRDQGVGDFRFWPEGLSDGNERHAIIYLEPMNARNRVAIGYDMYSEPVRREAMARARDAGAPAASGLVELVQEIDENDRQAGFLIYVPVYEGGDPQEIEARRARLAGFVYSPFRAGDLMAGVFGAIPQLRLHVAVHDGAVSGGSPLYISEGAEAAMAAGPGADRFSTTRSLNVSGRVWTVRYAAAPDFEFSSTRQLAPLVLAAGILVTLVLAGGSWRQAYTNAIVRRRTRELEAFNALGATLAVELELERMVQAVTDAGVELSGAEFGAFFYNNVAPGGDSYMLYTISGAPREAFNRFPHPRATAIFAPTFNGEGIVRSDDITQHPDYGKSPPYHGMPEGHLPVRSYLAAPVLGRDGEVIGGLFYGHHKAGRFDERTERVMGSLAAQAAIAIDNARLWRDMQSEIDHRKLLMDELNHRVKNTLATVQSMAAQTLRNTGTLEDFRDSFESRIIALSSTHNLLTKGNWKGASLRELLEAELAPFAQKGAQRVTLEGPDLRLRPAEATSLGMAFHELTTNAVKYGALSRPGGGVHVDWTVTAEQNGERLRILWRETGGPQVAAPQRRGFGSRLIERGLVGQHGGEAELRFDPEGVSCRIEIPLSGGAEDRAA